MDIIKKRDLIIVDPAQWVTQADFVRRTGHSKQMVNYLIKNGKIDTLLVEHLNLKLVKK
jgi:hypothetical protein